MEEGGDEWMLNTCCCLRPPPTHSFMWDNNGAEQNRGRNNTPQFLVCWFAIANVFYLFQKKKARVRRTRRVPQCLRYAAALVKDLIDYTRCDQCRANIKIGARPSWIYFPLLICIAQSSPAQPSQPSHPLHGNGEIKIYWNGCPPPSRTRLSAFLPWSGRWRLREFSWRAQAE